jgi:cytochrome c5
MTEPDQHTSLIKTPRQLVIVVVLAFAVPIAIFGLLSQLFTASTSGASENENRVLERIKPYGEVVVADASAPHGNLTGEQVYTQVCKTCHEAGLAGAPKAGDKAAWAPRIAEGEKTLLEHALGGFQGKAGMMPPKGGNADLADIEVHRAMVYMANLAGAGWKEPAAAAVAAAPAPAAPGATPASPATAATPSAAAAATAAPIAVASSPATSGGAAKADGKKVFEQVCTVCHTAGLAGAPKFGDKAAWAPRLATGMPALYNAALHGLNAMPAKGGDAALSDDEVKSAVNYMAAAAK